MTGKKQVVPAVPVDLSQAIESLHEHGTLTWPERKPWMLLGGCKEQRKHDRKVVRPSNSLALWETERVLVERLRLQLQVDPECRAAFHGPELLTPRTLKSFAESLKDERARCITPFGTDFRQVHLPRQWDGQHVLRRLALLEGSLASADSRCDWPLLDGILLQEIWETRCSVDEIIQPVPGATLPTSKSNSSIHLANSHSMFCHKHCCDIPGEDAPIGPPANHNDCSGHDVPRGG